jgi:tetratricopeptide (TPR) repeat protein
MIPNHDSTSARTLSWRPAEQRGDDDLRGRASCNLGFAARLRGDLETARSALELAVRLHQAIGDPHARVIDELNLVGVLNDLGEQDRAHELALQVVREADTFGDAWTLVEALENLAAVLSAQGRLLDAAWLFGAAAASRQRLAVPRPETEAPLYHRDVRRAREAAVDHDQTTGFAAAWREGETATLEQAVAVALGRRGGPGPGPPPTDA